MRIRTPVCAALLLTAVALTGCRDRAATAPAPHNVAVYRERLQTKLLLQHRAHPDLGRRVGRVALERAAPIRYSEDGRHCLVRWSQLVYDRYGRRMPRLEEEYFVVEFGPGAPRVHRRAPAVTVGLATEGTYSDYTPVRPRTNAADASAGAAERHCPACGEPAARAGLCPDCRTGADHAGRAASPPAVEPVEASPLPGRALPSDHGGDARRDKQSSARSIDSAPAAASAAPDQTAFAGTAGPDLAPRPQRRALAPAARETAPARNDVLLRAPEEPQDEAAPQAARSSAVIADVARQEAERLDRGYAQVLEKRRRWERTRRKAAEVAAAGEAGPARILPPEAAPLPEADPDNCPFDP